MFRKLRLGLLILALPLIYVWRFQSHLPEVGTDLFAQASDRRDGLTLLHPHIGNTCDLKQPGELIVLNFWMNYCPPCLAEIPALNEVEEWMVSEHKGRVIGMNTDYLSDVQAAELGVKMGMRFGLTAATAEQLELFGVRNLPSTVLLSADGQVLWTHQGQVTLRQLKTVIESKEHRHTHH